MNAVPASSAAGGGAARALARPLADEAELARTPTTGSATSTRMLDDVLGLVDAIRTYEPTSRTPDSRIWGPFADSNTPRLAVGARRDARRWTRRSFDYELDVAKRRRPDRPG